MDKKMARVVSIVVAGVMVLSVLVGVVSMFVGM